MSRKLQFGVVVGVLVAAFCGHCLTQLMAASAPSSVQDRLGPPSAVHSPVSAWTIAVPDGTALTATPYQPATALTAETIYKFPLHGFSGFVIRAKYLRGETLSTDPVVRAWVLKGEEWSGVKTSAGAGDITLADDATNDCDDATYKYTLPSDQIDAIGGDWGAVTVKTAGVSSSTGAIVIEITTF